MQQLSAKWKWFGLGILVSVILSILGTIHLVSERLAQASDHPDLAPPMLMVVVSTGMTFFGLMIPLIAILGTIIIIVDGYSRSGRQE